MHEGSGAEGGAMHTSSPHTPCAIQDGFALITLDRPEKRNALSVDMLTSLTDLLGVLERRDDVLALAITGAGGAFCAGADLSSVRQDDGTESARYRELVVVFLESVRRFPKPTVAIIDGACIGAGYFLALACDVRYATPDSPLAIPSVRYGIPAEPMGVQRLVELAGPGTATRFLLGAERWTAEVAQPLGLVDVCSRDAVAAAESFLRNVASFDPQIVSATRREIFSTEPR
jgi:enoyl-CoA hydratase/carnithine racemase